MVIIIKKIQWKELILSFVIALDVGGLSALLTPDSKEIYSALTKPPLAPPGEVFPIVWTALFILMAIAAYLVYVSDSSQKNAALAVYALQLFFQFPLDGAVFRLQGMPARIRMPSYTLGADTHNRAALLPHKQGGGVSYAAISCMGYLCRIFEFSDMHAELSLAGASNIKPVSNAKPYAILMIIALERAGNPHHLNA